MDSTNPRGQEEKGEKRREERGTTLLRLESRNKVKIAPGKRRDRKSRDRERRNGQGGEPERKDIWIHGETRVSSEMKSFDPCRSASSVEHERKKLEKKRSRTRWNKRHS